jgi:hypothetical protein
VVVFGGRAGARRAAAGGGRAGRRVAAAAPGGQQGRRGEPGAAEQHAPPAEGVEIVGQAAVVFAVVHASSSWKGDAIGRSALVGRIAD